MSKIIPTKPCAWCHEPFTPVKSSSPHSVDGRTVCCDKTCSGKYSGAKAKASGSLARAVAARKQKAQAVIDAQIPGLSAVEAYRLGFSRGWQAGYLAQRRKRTAAA